jgi:hypothetical protein
MKRPLSRRRAWPPDTAPASFKPEPVARPDSGFFMVLSLTLAFSSFD